jgi:hypothetical protein
MRSMPSIRTQLMLNQYQPILDRNDIDPQTREMVELDKNLYNKFCWYIEQKIIKDHGYFNWLCDVKTIIKDYGSFSWVQGDNTRDPVVEKCCKTKIIDAIIEVHAPPHSD